jgi:hypothetical protein
MLNKTLAKNEFLSPREMTPAVWISVGCLFLITGLGGLAGLGQPLRLLFPLGAFSTGLFLYIRHPVSYLGFTWWMWFITPLLARLVDYGSGWDPARIMLTAPYFVTLISLETLLRKIPKAPQEGGFPLVLAFSAVCYAFILGIVNAPLISVIRSTLDWISPLLIAFYLQINWRDYPRYRDMIQSTFLWGCLVMGSYGILQYLLLPEWDRYWLIQSGMFTSAGDPVPLGMRVWSTMHSPGPFSVTIAACLLILISTNTNNPLKIPGIFVGSLSFLLTLVRSAWGGFLVSLIILFISAKTNLKIRLIFTLTLCLIIIVPVASIEPFAGRISDRFDSIANIEQDNSFYQRSRNYDKNLQLALSTFEGKGFGNSVAFNKETGKFDKVVLDSGIMDIFFTLGWIGAIPYLTGLLMIIMGLAKSTMAETDSFMNASRSLGIGYSIQLFFGSSMTGVTGLLMWGFLGAAMASHTYHLHTGTTLKSSGWIRHSNLN